MRHRDLNAVRSGECRQPANRPTGQLKFHALGGICLAVLAGCAHSPKPVASAPALPPQGHPYQVMVEVPPPVSRHVHITPARQREVQQAFNVIALKSALMVAALSCSQQDKYDQFMTTFQPHVLAEQHVMDDYFRQIGGSTGRTKEDSFITLLANNQSINGIGQGGMFCVNNAAEYKAVLALRTSSDLDNFVTALAPDAVAVASSAASVKPLSPETPNLDVAVVQSGRHRHLVKSYRAKASASTVSSGQRHRTAHETASLGAKLVPTAATVSGKPLDVAAVSP